MDTNKDETDSTDEKMEIPTQEATLALYEGREVEHQKWVKDQAQLDKYPITRRMNKAKKALEKRIIRRNRRKTHSDYDLGDDSADYTTEEEKDEGVPEEEIDEELSHHRTTSPSTVQEVNNNRTTEEQIDEELPHEETEEQVQQHLTTSPSTVMHSNNNSMNGGANGFNISDIPLLGKENPSTQ
jgi:hypothetical protein